jgi:hypothetical protein
MKRCDLATGAGRIRYALETLQLSWREIEEEWDDAVSRRFSECHLEPIGPKVKLALDAIERMHMLLTQMQRDCEE